VLWLREQIGECARADGVVIPCGIVFRLTQV
jgi:hypothetical protein